MESVNHVHTGGNSSGIVDGSAAVLVGSEAFGKAAGLKPRAKIRGFASIGSEPTIMLTAPAAVSHKALRNVGMTPDDIDLWELNEAFASVVLRYNAPARPRPRGGERRAAAPSPWGIRSVRPAR